MIQWIRANELAQLIGILMHEFHLKFSDFEDMSAQQFMFLVAWLKWYNERLERRVRRK